MTIRSIMKLVPALAVALTALGTLKSNPAGAQEYIVSQQVVSDVKVDGPIDGAVVDDSGSYAGDMSAASVGRSYGQPDLFYNYYTQGQANATNAQMYMSPLPVPPNVGHTFFTYQPFYPEEMLYWHKNKFHNNYDNGRGLNRTRATYFSPPVRQAASNIYWNKLRIPR